jgi:hypothetical protein
MMNKQQVGVLLGLASLLVLGLTACGSPAGTSNAPKAGAEANNGEAPAVAYVDSRYHYRIEAPGRMTANADGSANFVGPSERLQVAVVQGGKAADVAALARDDLAKLTSSAAGFHLVSALAPITLNGHKYQKFVYSWDAGTSPVTGKPQTLVSVRYYVPKDTANVAVIAYGIVSNEYDPQGADDVASTFQWQ